MILSLFFVLIFFESKVKARSKQPESRKKNSYYQIANPNQPKILSQLKLKKGDKIVSIAGKKRPHQKQFHQSLYKALKSSKPFEIKFRREGKLLVFFYQKDGQNQLIVSQSKMRTRRRLASVKPASKKSPVTKAKSASASGKKNLVPDKYKPYMQRAFISSLNSFIYKEDDFDSKKLYSLPVGKKILISRKIFRPHHNFGSFYKIFLFGNQKIIGYISEAEVIPEYVRSNNKTYQLNPLYKKAKIYKDKNKVLNLEEIENITNSQKKRKSRLAFYKSLKKQIGLSSTWVDLNNPYIDSQKNSFNFQTQSLIGLDFGLQDIYPLHWLSAHVKSSLDFQKFYFELSAGHRLLNQPLFSVFVLGGAGMYWGVLSVDPPISFDFGPSGALLANIPLNKNIHFNVSSQFFYLYYRGSSSFNVSAGLRYHF